MARIKVFAEEQNPLSDQLLAKVLHCAPQGSVKLYLVGGFVRDCLWEKTARVKTAARGNRSKDLDFAVEGGSAFEFARTVARALKAHFVPLDQGNDTARVVVDDGDLRHWLDFAGCVGGTLESDIHRRDFTINALAWSADDPQNVIDLVGAMPDLESRTIRAISSQVLKDDPLRLLRAYRFKAVLNADIDAQTLAWIESSSNLIENVSAERINYEMFTLLECDGAGQLLESMGKNGLLEAIYPELKETRKVTPNAFHHLGLFDHSVVAVQELEAKLKDFPDWTRESFIKELSQGVSKLAATKLATLLHDIGKPATWQINEEGRHTFFGHDVLGAQMAEVTSERMKWSKSLSRFIAKMIKYHLRPGQLFHHGLPSERTVLRFFRKVGDDMPELILLAYGDLGATRGEGLPEDSRRSQAKHFAELLDAYLQFSQEVEPLPRLLTGSDVMKLLQIAPGPEVGEILNALVEAQGVKKVWDRQSAERFVQEYQQKKYSR